MSTRADEDAERRGRSLGRLLRVGSALRPVEVAVAFALAGASGAGIVAHVLLPVPLSFTAPFVVLPSAAVLALAVFLGRGRADAAHLLADRLVAGFVWGAVATAVYDVARPLIVALFRFSFDPYKAMPIFGHLITGRPTTDGLAIALGWLYHSWNGVTFGMMLALVRPEGGWRAGLAWGLVLQGFMYALYPSLTGVEAGNVGFLVTSLLGHAIWGVVLGAGLAHRARHRSADA